MKPKNVRIMMTGGHITPAIATIHEIRHRFPDWKIVFVGRKFALEGTRVISEEYHMIKDMDIRFIPIIAGRLKREGGVRTLMALLKVPIGCIQAFIFVLREKPDMIVSFGGYVALPIAISATLLRVPVITHEQTSRPGLANRIIASIATKVCVTFPDTAHVFSKKKNTVVTGLPVRNDILTPPHEPPFVFDPMLPILFIVGGSTGSVSINKTVFACLPELLRSYVVIHQVGKFSSAQSEEIARALPQDVRARYIPRSYLSSQEYSWALYNATLIVGRSGANTVVEIALAGAVAICIPLPWSANNEQFHNAQLLEAYGSVILPQKKLSPKMLISTIAQRMSHMAEYKAEAKHARNILPSDGARRFVDVIEQCVVAPFKSS